MDERATATRAGETGLRSDRIESEFRSYRIGRALRSLAEDLAQARRRIAVLERENREMSAQLERFTGRGPESDQGGHASATSKRGRA
jgi:hypothetical protein